MGVHTGDLVALEMNDVAMGGGLLSDTAMAGVAMDEMLQWMVMMMMTMLQWLLFKRGVLACSQAENGFGQRARL